MDNAGNTILVVDDERHIRDVLVLYLRKEGYRVVTAENGLQGLEVLASERPALIISDSMMPEMDGLEFCTRVKQDERFRDTLFIMLTGKTATNDKIEGLETGADEYLTKPFDNKELVARVNAFMRISRLQRELRSANEQLRALDALKNDLTHMIVHDMKTPISALMLSMDILLDEDMKAGLSEDHLTFLYSCKNSVNELFNMVMNLLDINRMEEGKMELEYERFDPQEVIKELQRDLIHLIENRELRFSVDLRYDGQQLEADRQVMKRVLMNLLSNAIKHTPRSGRVEVVCRIENSSFAIDIIDTGEGIPEEFLRHIFDKFSKGKTKLSRKYDTGLGLTFCKMAVQAHGGTISVQSMVGEGSTFTIVVPWQAPSPEQAAKA